MGTKNTRNAGLYLSATLGGTYTKISKTHGLKLSLKTDFSEDTSYGDTFKSQIPGLQDFSVTLMRWYETATTALESLSINKTSEYFMIYPDVSDTVNYYRGQAYFGLDELNLSLGNTADMSYTMVIANADIAIIRNGAAL